MKEKEFYENFAYMGTRDETNEVVQSLMKHGVVRATSIGNAKKPNKKR